MRTSHHCFALGVAAAALAALASMASADEGIFGPIHVASNRRQYTGRNCPIEIIFTASINFAPHTTGESFNYHWARSDGAKGPTRVVRVAPNQRSLVVRDSWRLGAAGRRFDASETIFLNSGNTHLREGSPTVAVVCQ